MYNAAYWIDRLRLIPHPEGGYYRQTYQAEFAISAHGGQRAVATAIYFLLSGKDFSALHRLKSDEMWHFYAGTALTVHVIDPTGSYSAIRIGPNAEAGEQFQAVVHAGCWFGSAVNDAEGMALVGCTVAPGFDFADFELADREQMMVDYPQHRELIRCLTRS